MKITITADNREKNSRIPGMLSAKNINVIFRQLFVGDYLINDEIVIERKTSEDFVQSIMDGRLFSQCAKLRKSGAVPLIIVEGNPYNTQHEIRTEAIKGALLSVSLSWQIPVIRSSGKEDTARLIVMASKQHKSPPVFIRRKGIKPKKAHKQQHYLVEGLPGIGSALAHRLLVHFKTIEQIILADVKSLEKVEGIGKVKAIKLFKFFRSGS
jgi:Fanconi anemia group M protein